MVVVPPETPVTTPVEAVTVATELLLVVHVPPVVALLNVMLLPWHTEAGPVMGVSRVTVSVVVAVQPAPVV